MYLRKITTLFLSIILFGCGDDDNAGLTTRSIIGTWEVTPEFVPCNDQYTFNEDGTFTSTSNEQITSGRYVFDETISSGVTHLLTIGIEADNGETDCNGAAEDNSGQSIFFNLEFSSDTEASAVVRELGIHAGTGQEVFTWRKIG